VRGDHGRHAFTDFYEATWPELAAFATAVGDGPVVGSDLAQEAMARVYARWPLMRNPRAYAFRIVSNLAKDRWRRQRTEHAAFALVDAGTARSTPHEFDSVLDAVCRLPSPLRDVVVLHYYADLPVAEIALVLRRPAGTVKSRLSDARAALALALKDSR
jgi:RNA polymerase sigma-70 factor (ECF subfamily)